MPSRVSEILLEQGRNAARARERSGDIWGQTVANLGQIPGQIMAHRDQQRDLETQRQMQQQRLKMQQSQLDMQQEQANEARSEKALLDKLMSSPNLFNPDGTVNRTGSRELFQSANAGHAFPQFLALADTLDEGVYKRKKHQQDAFTAKGETLGATAAKLEALNHDVDSFRASVAGLVKADYLSNDEATGYLRAQTPEDVKAIVSQWKAGTKAGEPKLTGIPAGGLYDERTGKIVVEPPASAEKNPIAVHRYDPETGKNVVQYMPGSEVSGQTFQAPEPRPASEKPTATAALNMTRQLRNDYLRETKAATTVQQQLQLMKASLDAVKAGSMPAGSQGILVTFQKILDPTSVVRESEYARSASGLSLMGRLEGAWLKIVQGGAGVTPKDLEQFVTLAEEFARRQKTFADETKKQVDAIADEYGLNKDLITHEVAEPTSLQAPPPPESASRASADIVPMIAPDGRKIDVPRKDVPEATRLGAKPR